MVNVSERERGREREICKLLLVTRRVNRDGTTNIHRSPRAVPHRPRVPAGKVPFSIPRREPRQHLKTQMTELEGRTIHADVPTNAKPPRCFTEEAAAPLRLSNILRSSLSDPPVQHIKVYNIHQYQVGIGLSRGLYPKIREDIDRSSHVQVLPAIDPGMCAGDIIHRDIVPVVMRPSLYREQTLAVSPLTTLDQNKTGNDGSRRERRDLL